MGEGCYSRIVADIGIRKKEGITIDTNILDFKEGALLLQVPEAGDPYILGVYNVQQIHCVRNREGEIIEVMPWP
jgi:hypothetical protein